MRRLHNLLIFLIYLIILSVTSAFVWYESKERTEFRNQIFILQKQISKLSDELSKTKELQRKNILATEEIENRQSLIKKSQDELLTATVARTSPAVVSIVVSKDVPDLEVTYQNPFGDDPSFGDFGIRVPVFRQKGIKKEKVGAGTGFLVHKSGYIVTNKHVVYDDQAEYAVLLSTGVQKVGTVIYKDKINDVAIVKIDGNNYPTVSLGNSDKLQLGQTVVAIGNALGEYNNSVSVGIISGLNRTISASGGATGKEELKGVIQTDAAINPGNSGGPLLDLDGTVLGVNVATVFGSSNISFSIPINTVKKIITEVVK